MAHLLSFRFSVEHLFPECPFLPLAKQRGKLLEQVSQTHDLTDIVPTELMGPTNPWA